MKKNPITKTLALALASAIPLLPAAAVAEENANAVLVLKLSSLETADMRAKKSIDAPNTAKLANLGTQDLPYSQADLAKLDGPALLAAQERNREIKHRNDEAVRGYALEQFKRADRDYQAQVAKLQQTTDGRILALSIDKFAGYLGEYSDCIQFFHRMDSEEALKEAAIASPEDDANVATAAYFVRLIFGDVQDSLSAVDLPGGTKITNLKYTRQLTVEVQDLAGRMIFSKNIEGVASARYSNAVQTNNKSEELLSKVTLDCLKKAADAIDERFVCEVTFEISGPKKDEDFDPDAVELTMDGAGIAAGTPMRMRKGIHEVVATLENYAQVGTKRMSFNADGVRKVVMKSTLCAVTLKVKGPAGDADFDPANATVQLIDAEENANDLSVDDETIVPQSKFRLVATMDGYTAREMQVNLSSAKKSITVTFVKEGGE